MSYFMNRRYTVDHNRYAVAALKYLYPLKIKTCFVVGVFISPRILNTKHFFSHQLKDKQESFLIFKGTSISATTLNAYIRFPSSSQPLLLMEGQTIT